MKSVYLLMLGLSLICEVSSAILGGTKVKESDPLFQSIVSVVRPDSSACGGVLIKANIVLTSAHSLQLRGTDDLYRTEEITVYHSTSNDPLFSSGYDVSSIRLHPMYSYKKGVNTSDLALIKLYRKPKNTKPASLHPDFQSLSRSDEFILYGYGYVNLGETILENYHLHKVKVQPQGISKDSISYANVHLKGLCFGDSGGPSFAKYKDSYFVVGIHQSGFHHIGQCLFASFDVNVGNHIDWINQNLKELTN